jgi:predicted RNA binding protein YcfA (HicA-like mRNA interferase family)
MKRMGSREVIDRLRADGWKLDRVKGSHHVFVHDSKPGIVVVPHPKKDLPTGTLRSILRTAGLR